MERVGDFQISEELEPRGLTSTFRAKHEDGSVVRLRVLSAGTLPDTAAIERFREDMRLASTVSHDTIAQPRYHSVEEPIHVATRDVDGVSLARVLADVGEGKLAPPTALGVACDLADALATAHGSGLVHGGLSAQVVLLDAEPRAVVTDYGFARLIASLASVNSQLMSEAIASMAPEQVSSGDVGTHTDVFALGVLLYRMLSGKEPFSAPSPLGMSMRVSMGRFDPLERHEPGLAADIRDLVHEMLSAQPASRPPVSAVLQRLGGLVDGGGKWRDDLRGLCAPHRASDSEPPEQEESTDPGARGGRDMHATIQQDGPLVAEADIPDFLRPGYVPPPAAPAIAPPVEPRAMSFGGPPSGAVAPAPMSPPPAAAPRPVGPPMAPMPASPPAAAPSLAAAPPMVQPAFVSSPPSAPAPEPPPPAVGREQHPTIRQDGPLVSEDEIPEFLRAGYGIDDELDDDLGPPTMIHQAPMEEWEGADVGDDLPSEPTRAMEAPPDPSGGFPSPYASHDEGLAPLSVPKTMVMVDPRQLSPSAPNPFANGAAAVSSAEMARPPEAAHSSAGRGPSAPVAPLYQPPSESGGTNVLGILLWFGVGLGAMVLLGGTVLLAIYLAG